MPDTPISGLTAATNAAATNEVAINEAGVSKKLTLAQIRAFGHQEILGDSGAAGPNRTTLCLTADTSNVTVTTQTTVMTFTGAVAGTWRVKGTLIFQTAATTTGIGIVLNHTGTVSRFVCNWIHVSTGGAAATGISDQVASTNTGQLVEGKAERVKNTRSSFIAGVDTANADELAVLDGVIVASTTGDITLSIASEVGGSAVRLESGSILEIDKVA